MSTEAPRTEQLESRVAGPPDVGSGDSLPSGDGDDGQGSVRDDADGGWATRRLTPTWAALLVVAVGLLITVAVSWTAWTLNRHNEHRLLVVQTRQAAAVLGSTILEIRDPLATALQIESATAGSPQHFSQYMAAYVGPGRLFVGATLWKADGTALEPVTSVGAPAGLPPSTSEAHRFISRALASPTFVVTSVKVGSLQRIGYAIADPMDRTYVVYAERSIPADREVPVEGNSAFSDLDYATYLGPVNISGLATTDVPVAELPITGDTSRAKIPFGDTTLTLVAAPSGQLGGTLGEQLPWVFLVGGVLLTAAAAFVTWQLVARRREAEHDAETITGLYDRLDGLFAEQRTIAATLQLALLPQFNPEIPNLEIATRYVAGADGVDIGGDWYSVVAVDDRHFAFVVGDVSGRGVSAATIMARLRFTVRAYLVEGHPPEVVLDMCAQQIDIDDDGHFATILVGLGDLQSREITLANAGHLNPLLVSGGDASYVSTRLGPPLGVTASRYASRTVVMPVGYTLVAFTDGLVERRTEGLEVGLQRLRRLATSQEEQTLEGLVEGLVTGLAASGAEDDIAVLAFRWTAPDQ